MLNIILSSFSKKFLRKINKNISRRIIIKIKSLRDDPSPTDSKRVVGTNNKLFRIRVGHYRITYLVFYNKKEIFIVDINKRSNIYKK